MSDSAQAARKPRILAVVNQKGGVGKTTTAINLGTGLAAVGRAVLIVDLDPQGNASTGLGVAVRDREISTYDLMMDQSALDAVIVETSVPRVSITPGSIELSGVDIELVDSPDRAQKLKAALDTPAGRRFDYILIDCPPSLNLLTINAMVAANAVLVPLQCEFFALEGLSQLLKTIEKVKVSLNKTLSIEGIILTMYDKRNNLSAQVAEDVRKTLGDVVFNTMIPRNVRLSEAPSYAMPALIYDHNCAGSQAYLHLAGEVLRRNMDIEVLA